MFSGALLDGEAPWNPRPELPIAMLFRFAVEDLKAYYAADSHSLADWFWLNTTAGRVLFAVHEVYKQSNVPGIQVVVANFLIPWAHSTDSPYATA